jgi:hypothetical protein
MLIRALHTMTESYQMLRVISLGAGVQSTTLALMAARGEVGPMPDCAIFADTGWEPKEVYTHLDWLEMQLPFPTYRVSNGNLRTDVIASAERGTRTANPPFFTKAEGGTKEGFLRRSCTKEYKIEPIRAKVRELIGLRPRQRAPKTPAVEQWIGISTDEALRMKPSLEAWRIHRWPLIEARMNRNDCLKWMERAGYAKPAKSACIGCPFHSDDEWRRLRDERPAEWIDAVEFDRAIRAGIRGTRDQLFVHRSLVPLDSVDLRSQSELGQLDMFNNECEGMCGV